MSKWIPGEQIRYCDKSYTNSPSKLRCNVNIHQMDDSDADENQCALSENWIFQHDQRRWSRCRDSEPLQPLENITSSIGNTLNAQLVKTKHSLFNLTCI